MKTKHTPAPWRAHGELINSDKREIAEIKDFKSNGETGANARLIASAPELLEALIKFRKLLPVNPAPDGWTPEWSRELDALIAKATGGES